MAVSCAGSSHGHNESRCAAPVRVAWAILCPQSREHPLLPACVNLRPRVLTAYVAVAQDAGPDDGSGSGAAARELKRRSFRHLVIGVANAWLGRGIVPLYPNRVLQQNSVGIRRSLNATRRPAPACECCRRSWRYQQSSNAPERRRVGPRRRARLEQASLPDLDQHKASDDQVPQRGRMLTPSYRGLEIPFYLNGPRSGSPT